MITLKYDAARIPHIHPASSFPMGLAVLLLGTMEFLLLRNRIINLRALRIIIPSELGAKAGITVAVALRAFHK